MSSETEYWKNRCLLAEKQLEAISFIPKAELASIASIHQQKVYDLKYKACQLLKIHDPDKWDHICNEALLSHDQIYYWTLKIQEGKVLHEYLASIK